MYIYIYHTMLLFIFHGYSLDDFYLSHLFFAYDKICLNYLSELLFGQNQNKEV